MTFFLRVVAGILLLAGLGTFVNSTWSDGPGGALSALMNVARVLDTVLLLVASYGFFRMAARREAREHAEAARVAAHEAVEPYLARLPAESQSTLRSTPSDQLNPSTASAERSPNDSSGPIMPSAAGSLAESRVEVHGYIEEFAVSPSVRVLWNGVEVGNVSRLGVLDFPIHADGEVSFRTPTRSHSRQLKAGQEVKIRLAWDPETGALRSYFFWAHFGTAEEWSGRNFYPTEGKIGKRVLSLSSGA